MLTVTRVLPPDAAAPVVATLSLTASDRAKSRHRFTADDGTPLYLNLARGTVLRGGDLLSGDAPEGSTGTDDASETRGGGGCTGAVIRVVAKPEPVVVVTAASGFALLRAAYHLGNRHVALELATDCLKLEPDPVLEAMLSQLGGLELAATTLPFEPEAGAYRSGVYSHPHDHDHN